MSSRLHSLPGLDVTAFCGPSGRPMLELHSASHGAQLNWEAVARLSADLQHWLTENAPTEYGCTPPLKVDARVLAVLSAPRKEKDPGSY